MGDANANTYTSPGFSFADNFSSINGGAPSWGLGGASYTGGPAASGTSGVLPAMVLGDWIRLQLVVNTTTNGGMGTGTLSFMDLTQGTPTVTLISNFNMNLKPGGNLGLWTTMFSRSDLNSSVVIDNLTVTPVPEMNGAWIALGAAGVIGFHFLRRRRSEVRLPA